MDLKIRCPECEHMFIRDVAINDETTITCTNCGELLVIHISVSIGKYE